ncbi:MAG TPA: hypothetical protein VJ951_11600 [Bacteroidales bacterium]|nr:hypothetical protein [Bacteroidales bacterium]
MNRITNLALWILSIGTITCLVLPGLFMDGMFTDGIQYTCVSKNLSNGLGSFWFPFVSETWGKEGGSFFLEQPPLLYGLQAPFFKILGDSMYTERIYIFITLIINALLIIQIWRYIAPDRFKKYGWLPLIFWISIPLTNWTFKHNMQENTMMIFTSASIYFGIQSLFSQNKNYFYAFLAGIFIFLASFTKGIPGLFPLSMAIIAWITHKNFSLYKALLLTSIFVLTPIAIYVFLMLSSESAMESIQFYINSRLLVRVDSNPVVNNRFYILERLILELLPGIAVASLLLLGNKRSHKKILPEDSLIRNALFFFILGLAGSLPLMLTLVQRGFYMTISFPPFAIAFSLLSIKAVINLFSYIKMKRARVFLSVSSILLLSGIILTLLLAGKPKRNKDVLSDVYTFSEHTTPYTTLGCDRFTFDDWHFQFYMIRYNDVYLNYTKTESPLFYIAKKKEKLNIPGTYEKLAIPTEKYDLYKRTSTMH